MEIIRTQVKSMLTVRLPHYILKNKGFRLLLWLGNELVGPDWRGLSRVTVYFSFTVTQTAVHLWAEGLVATQGVMQCPCGRVS